MIPKTNEKHLQNNTIALLKAMGWQFITPKEMHDYRDNTSQVVLKDILLKRLQVLNSFEYKNNRYLFSDKNLAKAIASLLLFVKIYLRNASSHSTLSLCRVAKAFCYLML
jgi:hypothetical protein